MHDLETGYFVLEQGPYLITRCETSLARCEGVFLSGVILVLIDVNTHVWWYLDTLDGDGPGGI